MSLFKKNPRTYIRMLWVMANYVSYCSEAMENLQPILVQLFG
jgi:ABC-type microcin C transport system permease subunit YejE